MFRFGKSAITISTAGGLCLQQVRRRGDDRPRRVVPVLSTNTSETAPPAVVEVKKKTTAPPPRVLVPTVATPSAAGGVKPVTAASSAQSSRGSSNPPHQQRASYFQQQQSLHQDQQMTTVSSVGSLLPEAPTEQATSKQISSYLLELAYRSAYARERLKERIKEPSKEIALRQLRDFVDLYKWKPHELAQMRDLGDVERLELLFDLFGNWYFATKAPKTVKMEQPWDWFPKARSMKRRIIFHCGPTNSGKTHQALDALMKAKSGVYCAPLKALAAQVWKKVDAVVPCDLVIGDERIFGGAAEHVSCTMEMTPVDMIVDVGVIDEIQLIDDRDRGWAWTRALIGLPAKELHICGEERSLDVIKALLWQTREDRRLEVRRHNRLVPLALSDSLQGKVDNLQNGDCLVAFSRKGIFELKSKIESQCQGAQVNVIYGGLPFGCRETEARCFNEGVAATAATLLASNSKTGELNSKAPKHILVSTDAIAYGLNMNVRRIIFASTKKFDGKKMTNLSNTTVLQVGGRAGRFGLDFGKLGFCTTLYPNDLHHVQQAFESTLPRIGRAGLMPTADILAVYAELHSSISSFSELMKKFVSEASSSKLFFVCDMSRSLLRIAAALDPIEMPMRDKIVFCFVPLSDSSAKSMDVLVQWARMHGKAMSSGTNGQPADDAEVDLLLDDLFQVLQGKPAAEGTGPASRLMELEGLYRMTEVYCWLSWRFIRTFKSLEKGKELKIDLIAAIEGAVDSIPRGRRNNNTGKQKGNFSDPDADLEPVSWHSPPKVQKWLLLTDKQK